MKATNKLLDTVRQVCEIRSDAALAEHLHVTRALISGWRQGLYPIPELRIAELCKMAKLDAPLWNAEIQEELAKAPEERAMWKEAIRRLTVTTAAVFLLFGSAAANSEKAYASNSYASTTRIDCILCKSMGSWIWRILKIWLSSHFPRKDGGPSIEACL